MKPIKMTIDVPAPLKQQMDAAGDINWNEVAQAAFEAKLQGQDWEIESMQALCDAMNEVEK